MRYSVIHMSQIILIAHNLRSAHNVGSLIRTAEGLGIYQVYLTGYTPYPKQLTDERLPHLMLKIDKQINKTALGAEKILGEYEPDINHLITKLKGLDYAIVALEQSKSAIKLHTFKTPDNLALIVGREVEGIEPEILKQCDSIIEIPMKGKKESFNVVQAAAMALYQFTYLS